MVPIRASFFREHERIKFSNVYDALRVSRQLPWSRAKEERAKRFREITGRSERIIALVVFTAPYSPSTRRNDTTVLLKRENLVRRNEREEKTGAPFPDDLKILEEKRGELRAIRSRKSVHR